MSEIRVSNLTFAYEGSYDNIFENASFQLDTDWKIGFIGRNGRGKTTFMNLLMGNYVYTGNISSSVQFDYFPFTIKDDQIFTIDILTEISNAPLWQINRELSLLAVDGDVLYRPFSTLSNGEQTKAMLAGLFLKDNYFLLIDEPTNHLDKEARKIVSRYLQSKKGFILVSHDRDFLDSCVDHIISINAMNIEVQRGNFTTWWQNKQNQDNLELAQNKRLKSEIKELSATARRTADWADKVEKSKKGVGASGLKADTGYVGHKSAKMMKRAKNTETRMHKAIEDKSKLLKNIDTADNLKIHPLPLHTNPLIYLQDISITYGLKKVCSHVSFEIEQGDRIALNGKNGSGKSSILKLLLQQPIEHTGTLSIAPGLVISYVAQNTLGLQGSLTEYARQHQLDESLFKAILRKLDFSRTQFDKDIGDFSGGQKKKVLLAKSLCQPAHLYVWDEPLNFIDVLSRIQIENLILEYTPTMIFVEHDQAFNRSIATKTIEL